MSNFGQEKMYDFHTKTNNKFVIQKRKNLQNKENCSNALVRELNNG